MSTWELPMHGDGFLKRWFWGVAFKMWRAAVERFGRRDLQARGFLRTNRSGDPLLADDDELAILTALLFALEVLERSELSGRAHKHLEAVALARLHRCKMDWIRELPPLSQPSLHLATAQQAASEPKGDTRSLAGFSRGDATPRVVPKKKRGR